MYVAPRMSTRPVGSPGSDRPFGRQAMEGA
jgi:hypothetical protein